MKKSLRNIAILTFLVAWMFPFLQAAGQNIITDNFDTYIANQKLVQQGAPNWTTWSNLPGSGEDPYVKTTQARSTPNSIEINGTVDAVLLFNDKTTGRYTVDLWVYVPSGKVGYYNLLQDFAGSNSEWGMQAYFDEGGIGSADCGGAGTGQFLFSYNTWILVHNVIDLDQDYAMLYIDGAFIVDWKWSSGSFGTGTLDKLDAMDIYAWTGSSGSASPDMFVDDVSFDQITAPEAPINLQAVVNGVDVDLTWEIPSGSTPVGYRVYRDNVYAGYALNLNYTDASVYPGTHTYYVRADYGDQLSAGSNTADAFIPGGTTRTRVLCEFATGTWCQYCPGAAMGADQMVENGDSVAVIEYHSGDSYEIPAAVDRINYYNITGFPTAEFDGVSEVVGGNQTQTMYPTYQPIYESRIPVKALFGIQLWVDWADNTNVVATVVVTKAYDYSGGPLYLRLALTESNIPQNWFGLTEVDYVCRDMYPSSVGTLLDFGTDSVLTFTFPISVDASFVWSNLELTAFIQDDNTTEVMNSSMFPLTMTGIPEPGKISLSLSPNPVSDRLLVKSTSDIRLVTVYNSLGQIVTNLASDTPDLSINTSGWKQGMYFVTVKTESGTRTEKIIKN